MRPLQGRDGYARWPAARLGGEEFALLLASADEAKAVAAAERLRYVVSENPVEVVGRVTVSLGVATCPAHATTERALYAASDAALYQAKREGRDRIAVAAVIDNKDKSRRYHITFLILAQQKAI